MPQGKTLYDLLGVSPAASAESIAAALTSKQAELEGRGDVAPGEAMGLREAHRILGNPERRRKYDATLAARAPQPAPPEMASRGKSAFFLALAIVAVIAGGIGWKLKPEAPPEQAPRVAPIASSEERAPASEPAEAEVEAPPEAEKAAPTPSPPPEEPATGPELPPGEIYGLYWPSVVRVSAADAAGNFVRQGSGVVTSKDTAVTHCHLVKDAAKITVRDSGTDRSAVMTVADEELGLCKLQVSEFYARVVKVSTLAGVRPGQRVYVVGASWETERALAEGVVASVDAPGKSVTVRVATPVPPSWDGGALFSIDGRLIGVLRARNELGKDTVHAMPADWIGKIEARAGPPPPPAATPQMLEGLILGRWRCQDAWGKHNGEYIYGTEGDLMVIWDRKGKGGVRVPFTLDGVSVRYAARGEQMTLQVDSIGAVKMVQYFDSGKRLFCERLK